MARWGRGRGTENWTAAEGHPDRGGFRHFRVVAQRGRGAERRIELQALLEPGFRLTQTAGQLGDASLWRSGWGSVVTPGADDGAVPPEIGRAHV